MSRHRRAVGTILCALAVGACSSGPPPDLAPDPALLSRIQEIQINVARGRVCPGSSFQASYAAILVDGGVVPFSTQWDKDNPPRLHVVMLQRTSLEATPHRNGGWRANPDPLISARHGFRLRAFLKADPSLQSEAVVAPDYSCMPHAFAFEGAKGRGAEQGAPGPDVTVRMGTLRSPFYDRLLVVGVEVGMAPPFFVLADLREIPPADWLEIETVGGHGGRGVRGVDGRDGRDGRAGCPGADGADGSSGGPGGPGGTGGTGGRVTIVAPDQDRFLAGLISAYSVGGEGGAGGAGGEGGEGGKAGEGEERDERRCQDGRRGRDGRDGPRGPDGADGHPGSPPQIITVSGNDVFGRRLPLPLVDLLRYSEGGH